MKDIIRIEDCVPAVYCNDSRDFQLLCRAFTAALSQIKLNVDSMRYLTDTRFCKSSVLNLLATKLGFITSVEYDDLTLRYVLQAFPDMVKNKGSLKAIKQCINTYLKVNGIHSSVSVWYTAQPTQVYNVPVSAHTVVIAVDSRISADTTLLYDMLRFVLPAGVEVYVYFFGALDYDISLLSQQKAVLLFVSEDINAVVRQDIQKENWQERAVRCTSSSLQVSVDWDKFYDYAYLYPYGNYIFTYSDGVWKDTSLDTVLLSDIGIHAVGDAKAEDRIEVYSFADEVVGAVDTVSLMSNDNLTPDTFEVKDISSGGES